MTDSPDSFYPTLIPVTEELRGPRIILRRHRADEAAELFAALEVSRERLSRWLGFHNQLRTIEATRDFLIRCEAQWLLREMLGFTIWHGETHAYLGGIDIHSIAWDRRFFALGYWLCEGAEGQGYMNEAVRLVTDYAFSALNANKVALRCDARNTQSAAVAEALGFVLEGRLRSELIGKDGSLTDELQYACTRSDPPWANVTIPHGSAE